MAIDGCISLTAYYLNTIIKFFIRPTSTALSNLFLAAVFFSPLRAATTVHSIAGSDHSWLISTFAFTSMNDAATVNKGKKSTLLELPQL